MFRPVNAAHRPILCYVTDRKLLGSSASNTVDELLAKISQVASAGVDWIQIRERDLSGRAYSSLVREALRRVNHSNRQSDHSTRILSNDRLDVATAEGLAGVHLGENSFPVQAVRDWLSVDPRLSAKEKFLAGVSCHSLEKAVSAARDGADYIFFGPVFETPSKAGFGAPQGLDRLARVCDAVAVPVLAIGGVDRQNAPECLAAGASGIAAIRMFQNSASLKSLVNAIG